MKKKKKGRSGNFTTTQYHPTIGKQQNQKTNV